MNEKLLYYIWQFQIAEMGELRCINGKKLYVISCGVLNHDQGPDFLHAKIRYEHALWIGQVEIHVLSSDWFKHQHQHDSNYNNVILHVVWEHDARDVLSFPTLELKPIVADSMVQLYKSLMKHQGFIACEKYRPQLPRLIEKKWMERLLAERLTQKAGWVLEELKSTVNHWDEVCWRIICRGFGGKVNGEAFYQLSRSLPWRLLRKYRSNRTTIESLLMGQLGLLNVTQVDDYIVSMQESYCHLKRMHQLVPVSNTVHFLRMRPVGFPTIRLSQLAAFVHGHECLMSDLLKLIHHDDITGLFDLQASHYWNRHFVFDTEPGKYQVKKTGRQFNEHMLINVVVPLLFAFGWYHHDEGIKTHILQLLEKLPAECNQVSSSFIKLGWECSNAFESQAMLQLKSKYCDTLRCLECAVGNELMKNKCRKGLDEN